MADQNSQFMAILTAVGEARLANAQALGIAWNITQLGVGDGNGAEPMPDRLQTALLNERRRAPLNQLKVDPNNASIIIAEQVIPEDVGGWWIREIGLYDEAGDLVAVANCPPTFKPQLAQGSGRTQVVRLNLLVSSTQSITLKIDPSVVLATRAYCDGKIAEELAKLDHKQSVRAATTANIALSGLQTIDGVVLVAGDRVLVKNQTAAKDNGLYVAAAGAWSRAVDADLSAEVTAGLVVHVEQGATLADTRWQLVTDGTIVLGITALTFQNITQGYAPLASPAFTGAPTSPTPPQFDNDTSLATTEFVQRALGNFRKAGARAGNYALTDADTGSLIVAASSATPLTYTMPAIADFPLGACFTVVNLSGQKITLAPNGTERFIGNLDRSGSAASYMVENGDTCTVTKYQGGLWLVSSVGGTMPALLAVNGYERRPSGVIEQWGSFAVPAGATGAVSAGAAWEFTLPTTFPNGCFQVVASFANPNAGTTGAEVSGNKIYLKNSHTAVQTVRWMAKGN